MSAKVKITVVNGKLQGKEFIFGARRTFTVGRATESSLRFPSDEDHQSISRHHCVFVIDPPNIEVRDAGSLNGTFVNGEKIGQRDDNQSPASAVGTPWPTRSLNAGDEVRLGDTVFRIDILVPAAEVPKGEEERAAQTGAENGLLAFV